MTAELKQKAVEYTDSIEEKKHWSDENDSNAAFTREEVEQAYISGATEETMELQEQIAELKMDYEALNLLYEQDETEIRQLKGKLSMCGGVLR
jgi:hypothetical protein